MERINHPSATPDHKFTEGDPALGIPATTVTANHMNGVQEELIHILEEAGITPDGANLTQVLEALRALFARKTPLVDEITWTPLVSGITSTVKTKKMQDNTLHIYGVIDKASGTTVSPGAPLLGIPGDPFGLGANKSVRGIGFEDAVPTAYIILYNSGADQTQLGYYPAGDSAPHPFAIWQVVPCLGL